MAGENWKESAELALPWFGIAPSMVVLWWFLDGVPFGEPLIALAKEGFGRDGCIHPILLGRVPVLHDCNVRAMGKWGFGGHVGDAGRSLEEAGDDVDLVLARVADQELWSSAIGVALGAQI